MAFGTFVKGAPLGGSVGDPPRKVVPTAAHQPRTALKGASVRVESGNPTHFNPSTWHLEQGIPVKLFFAKTPCSLDYPTSPFFFKKHLAAVLVGTDRT